MDKKAFIQFYNEQVNKIYRFIYFRVDLEETAQDLTSEAFLKTWQSMQTAPKTKIQNPRAFLYQTAKNLVTDFYRQKPKFDVSLASFESGAKEPVEEASFVDKINFDLEFEKIKSVLTQIQPEQQEAVTLRFLNEMEVSEIAKIMDKTENHVRVILHRGLTALRKLLREI